MFKRFSGFVLGRTLICMVSLYFGLSPARIEAAEVVLSIEKSATGEWFRLSTDGPAGMVHRLEGSTGLERWDTLAIAHEGFYGYPITPMPLEQAQFFRATVRGKLAADDWKNQIVFPFDPFLSPLYGAALDEIQWVKFAILLDDDSKVVFQDSRKYPFHYDFATARIERFGQMTRTEFDDVSLYLENQSVLLGAVLYPWPADEKEFGIQFAGNEPLPVEMIARYFNLVRSVVSAAEDVNVYYLPTFEQAATAEANRQYFEERGIAVGSATRWLSGDQIYSEGWAVGTLRYFAADQISDAYVNGSLAPSDILVTDAVPAEIPFLTGVITLSPATPNSHVAILSRSFQIPFAFPAIDLSRAKVMGLVGHKIGYRAYAGFAGGQIEIIDLEGRLGDELEKEILAIKAPESIGISVKESLGTFSVPVDTLTPTDVKHVGGKAANFGFLRREIPDNSPPAIAFTFDLWDAFMSQSIVGGQTLGAIVAEQLDGHTYPPNMASLSSDLNAVRELIKSETTFDASVQAAVFEALADFDSTRKIRFRSSTNVEDTERFSGAGLYDSFSGCLADDLDSDDVGPSACDPTQSNERGVLRAIRKVYASFYNDNAFLERLRHEVDESHVGMAILVHYSFPDDFELANGVATISVRVQGDSLQLTGDMVTQHGFASVTNPDESALPEVVRVAKYSFGSYFNITQWSGLLPLGQYVLAFDQDYRDFVDLFANVADAYSEYFPGKDLFTLDFEFKKTSTDGLIVKQVRELPSIPDDEMIVPFILNEPIQYSIFQGERGDVFSNHRLKSLWQFETRSARLSEANLDRSLFTSASHHYLDGSLRAVRTGNPSEWEEYSFTHDENLLTESWGEGSGSGHRKFNLRTRIKREVTANSSPILILRDFEIELTVAYASPQPTLNFDGKTGETKQDFAVLAPRPLPKDSDLPQHRRFAFEGGAIAIDTKFYWPHDPFGPVAGYTAPLVGWEETTISGLTTDPITLRGYFSQTYRPGHHNFTEEYIFEPGLEEGLSSATLAELESQNIRLIHVTGGLANAPLRLFGFDGEMREVN